MLTDHQVYQVREEVLGVLQALGLNPAEELARHSPEKTIHDVIARPVVAFSAPHPNHRPHKADLVTLRKHAEDLERQASELEENADNADERENLETRIAEAQAKLDAKKSKAA